MKNYPMLSFRCDKQFRKIIEQHAKTEKVSVGEFIRQALRNHIEQRGK